MTFQNRRLYRCLFCRILILSLLCIECIAGASQGNKNHRSREVSSRLSVDGGASSRFSVDGGAPLIEPFIYGGEPVGENDPVGFSTVMLETDSQYCSAVIVAEDRLLTAAHCLPTDGSRWMEIHFKGLEGGVDRKASGFMIHPQYQDRGESTLNDLALIFFEGGLPSSFKAVPLLKEEASLKIGESMELAGFGEGGPLGQLMKIRLVLTGQSLSERRLYFEQTRKRGICHGDSGGPAYRKTADGLELVGIASYVQEYNCNGYSAYTATSNYRDWIMAPSKKRPGPN